YETVWAVELGGRRLTVLPPKPKAFAELDNPQSWFVDLQKDLRTGRAIKELQPPPSPVVFELLNGPCPPEIEHPILARAGDATECISIRCSGKKDVARVYLPTSEELFSEILRERGVESSPDEKRKSYGPVIKRFGGLRLAASAFSGESGTILQA